ncbi:MAG: helix-turn-helix transcriptional regulator [Victivallales bacterium]
MITENVSGVGIGMLTKQLDKLVLRAGWRHWVAIGPGVYHGHSGWELVYHPANQGEIRLKNGSTIYFEPGDIVVTPPSILHVQNNTVAGQDFCLVVDLDLKTGAFPCEMIHFRRINHDEFITGELDYLTSGVGRSSGAIRKILDYRMRALLAALLFNAREESPVRSTEAISNDYVASALRLMDESYTDINLEIRRVARKTGVSSDYLRHLFQTELGISPKRYLLRLRIERIEELLCHSNLSLKEIAALSGFANERYLCFYYRQARGITPGAFRHRRKALP